MSQMNDKRMAVPGGMPEDREQSGGFAAKLNDVFHDPAAAPVDRLAAGMLLLGSCTCMRPSTLLSLRTDCLETHENGVAFIRVGEGVKNGDFAGAKTEGMVCHPFCRKIIEECLELRGQCKGADESDCLLIDARGKNGTRPWLLKMMKRFCGGASTLSMLRMARKERRLDRGYRVPRKQ